MTYVDAFLLPIKKSSLEDYRAMSRTAGRIWRDHGALEYRECAGEDLDAKGMLPFTGPAGAKRGETVIVAWIVYRDRKHRDRVNAKVMKDPRIAKMTEGRKMPFDCTRMAYGGFEVIVDA